MDPVNKQIQTLAVAKVISLKLIRVSSYNQISQMMRRIFEFLFCFVLFEVFTIIITERIHIIKTRLNLLNY